MCFVVSVLEDRQTGFRYIRLIKNAPGFDSDRLPHEYPIPYPKNLPEDPPVDIELPNRYTVDYRTSSLENIKWLD